MPLLLGHGMSLYRVLSIELSVLSSQPSDSLLRTYNSELKSLLLSSLSFYFFQYVKERFLSPESLALNLESLLTSDFSLPTSDLNRGE
jgi:hypothetical protein